MLVDTVQLRALASRLIDTRTELMKAQPFLGRLLMRLSFGFDECGTAYTDMRRIVFDPAFASRLDDTQLRFLMLHEVLHCVLKHCTRGRGRFPTMYNVACDIVVNSLALDAMGLEKLIVDKQAVVHTAPDGREGRLCSAEEIYEMLLGDTEGNLKALLQSTMDTHEIWGQIKNNRLLEEVWNGYMLQEGKSAGFESGIPQGLSRVVHEVFTAPKIDWRQLLRDLLQPDGHDYTFMVPDRRFSGDVVLPSFQENIEGERIERVWFLVDTSGSVSNKALATALAEVRDVVEQVSSFRGELSFFDSEVTEPAAFESVDELKKITPVGGGGTSFCRIFEYMKEHYGEEPPKAVIILTDGYADFPPESEAGDTIVIWLIVDSPVVPPWGHSISIPK